MPTLPFKRLKKDSNEDENFMSSFDFISSTSLLSPKDAYSFYISNYGSISSSLSSKKSSIELILE